MFTEELLSLNVGELEGKELVAEDFNNTWDST